MHSDSNANEQISAIETAVLSTITESETVGLLRELVQIDTVNPPGHVDIAARICSDKLAAHGFSCAFVQLEEHKPNLIAAFGNDQGPTLCFNAHLDVVPVGDERAWNFPPFSAKLHDGRLYGRGALDDKASVTAQIMAAIAIARSGLSLNGKLIVNVVADEEIGGPAGAALVVNERYIVPDFVIVGEPTLNRVCVGERGGGLVRIEVKGRTAHGALPWEGANAIDGMAEILSALRAELWPKLSRRTHPYFHHSSASVNGIEGGVKDNVVPDLCIASIDRRFIPGDDPDECLAEIDEIAQRAATRVAGVSVRVFYSGEVSLARMTDPNSLLVRAMQVANGKLGLSMELNGFSMATDGRFFAAAGYPTIIYGPGDPSLAHVPNESIGIAELMEATRSYALAAVKLLGS